MILVDYIPWGITHELYEVHNHLNIIIEVCLVLCVFVLNICHRLSLLLIIMSCFVTVWYRIIIMISTFLLII